ncbi:MAG: hypothetical protein L6R35_007512 [Caloplaca aegaea]|nr:MAG: hypothetical protein L6R35_007512 [Caloplaca aegaea]
MSKLGADSQFHSLESQLLLILLDAEKNRQSENPDPKRDLGGKITLRETDIKDAAVVENCVEAREIFASYIKDCENVETVEFGSDAEFAVEEAEHRVKTTGVLAKARVLDEYFVEYPTHDEIMGVMRSILKDLEDLLQTPMD